MRFCSSLQKDSDSQQYPPGISCSALFFALLPESAGISDSIILIEFFIFQALNPRIWELPVEVFYQRRYILFLGPKIIFVIESIPILFFFVSFNQRTIWSIFQLAPSL